MWCMCSGQVEFKFAFLIFIRMCVAAQAGVANRVEERSDSVVSEDILCEEIALVECKSKFTTLVRRVQ
ncbi:hypothetical protein BD779DRAFT_1569274 [Infundibulicybe gibba]|nr:hypothetical protein BD779DRAFT_1569274 [Infundibulicybe gibba]